MRKSKVFATTAPVMCWPTPKLETSASAASSCGTVTRSSTVRICTAWVPVPMWSIERIWQHSYEPIPDIQTTDPIDPQPGLERSHPHLCRPRCVVRHGNYLQEIPPLMGCAHSRVLAFHPH